MKTRKKMKGAGALVLAAILAVSVFTGVQAAPAVDVARDCTVTFSVNATTFPDFGTSVADGGAAMDVKLYKVADMTASGAFGTPTGAFRSLSLPGAGGVSGNAGEPAAVWADLAKQAYEIVKPADADTEAVTATATAKIGAGETGTASGLKPGLYLVAGGKVESANYSYEFAPYLISLPHNDYLADTEGGSDEWVYEVTSELKLERADLFGSLEISKTLTSYNATLGPVTFLFQVEGAKNDGRPQEKVESNVVELTFDGPGSKTAKIEGIPAGAQVTVTELSGSGSYSLAANSTGSQTVTILKNTSVSATFRNEYNNGVIGGHTIVNRFTNDNNAQGTWTWTQFTDGEQTAGPEKVQGRTPVAGADQGTAGGTTGGADQGTTEGTTGGTDQGTGNGAAGGSENAGGQGE